MTTNFERAFAERPEVYEAWVGLNGAIKAGMDLRRYELATLAAARRLRSSYCCLAHGKVLLEQFREPVREIALDHRSRRPRRDRRRRHGSRGEGRRRRDVDRRRRPAALRDLGLSETEIMDVVLAAAARCFFSKTLDALGVRADASYHELDPELRDALVVGRPIAEAQRPYPEARPDDERQRRVTRC